MMAITSGSSGIFLDDFNDTSKLTLEGDAVVRDGNLTLDVPVLLEDDFERAELTPWTLAEGTASIVSGQLQVGPDAQDNTTASQSVSGRDVRLSVRVRSQSLTARGPWVSLVLDEGRFSVYYEAVLEEMRMTFDPSSGGEVVLSGSNMDYTMTQNQWYDLEVKVHDDEMGLRINNGDYSWERWSDISRTGDVRGVELRCAMGYVGIYDDIVVEGLDATGTATSVAIELPAGSLWDMSNSSMIWVPYEVVGTVELIDALTGAVIPGGTVGQESDIEGIDFTKHPSLRLRARMWLEGFRDPSLRFWSVSWKPGGVLWMDTFECSDNYTLTGNATAPSTGVYLNKTVWTDEFDRSTLGPWAVQGATSDGIARIQDGMLVMQAPTTTGEALVLDRAVNLDGLRIEYGFAVGAIGPGGLSMALVTGSGKAISLEYDPVSTRMKLYTWDGVSKVEKYQFSRLVIGRWYDGTELYAFRDNEYGGGYSSSYMGAAFESFRENYTRVRIVCGQGTTARFDDMIVTRERTQGTVLSECITPPKDHGYLKLRYRWDAWHNNVTVDVLDGQTGLPIPGFTGIAAGGRTTEYGGEFSLVGINPLRHPSIRLRANLKQFGSSQWIDWWQVWFTPSTVYWMEPFDDGTNVTATGDVEVADGALATSNVVLRDEFWRHDLGDWSMRSGQADIKDAQLGMWGTTSLRSRVAHGLPRSDRLCVECRVRLTESANPKLGPAMDLISGDGKRLRYAFEPYYDSMTISMSEDGSSFQTLRSTGFNFNEWVRIWATYDGENASFRAVGRNSNATVVARVAGLGAFEELELISGESSLTEWDDLLVTTSLRSGTGITAPVTIPKGLWFVTLEMEAQAPPGAQLVASLVDGQTGEPIPGWGALDLQKVNLTGLDLDAHPAVALSFEMSGVWSAIPRVDWCRIVVSSSEDLVFQVRDIGPIEMREDEPAMDVMDLSQYFGAVLTAPLDLVYEVREPSDPTHVRPDVYGPLLRIDLPTQDWYGEATFRLNVSTSARSLETPPILVVVSPVDDPPAMLDTGVIEVTEDEPRLFDLEPYLTDVDTPVADLTITSEERECTVQGHSLLLNYTFGNFDGVVLIHISDGTSTVHVYVRVRVSSVNDPPVIEPGVEVTVIEDQVHTFDLAGSVWDEETPSEGLTISCEHPIVISVVGTVMTVLSTTGPARTSVLLSVSDGVSFTEGAITVVVEGVNDPPYITGIGDLARPNWVEAEHGEEAWLSIHVEDEDSRVFDFTITPARSFLEVTRDGQLHILASVIAGDYQVRLVVDDRAGGSDTLEFTLYVEKKNEPPGLPVVVSPANHTTVREGDVVAFEVEVADPDLALGQRLTVTWTSDISGHIRTLTTDEQLSFSVADLPIGTHRITVKVSDGQFVREAWFELTVLPIETPDGDKNPLEHEWVWAFVVLIVIIAVAFIGVYYWSRARKA